LQKFNPRKQHSVGSIPNGLFHQPFTQKTGTSHLRQLLMLGENTQETNGAVVECIREPKGRCAMTKTRTLTALAAATTLGLAAVAAPQPAEARHGGAVAAGIIGGLAVGAIIGAAANGPYYGGYGYGPGYYYGGGPYYGGCYWTRQRVWDGWGWHFRRVRVCG
jgi:hypothetical protein